MHPQPRQPARDAPSCAAAAPPPGPSPQPLDSWQLLKALTEPLQLLSEARCAAEGEAALLAAVNADLTRVLRRLRLPRPSTQQPPGPQHVVPAAQHVSGQQLGRQQRGSAPRAAAGVAARRSDVRAAAQPASSRRPGSSVPIYPIEVLHQQQQAQQQQQAPQQPGVARQRLDSDLLPQFRQLAAQCSTLEQQLRGADIQQRDGLSDVTSAAAGGFLSALHEAYGGSPPTSTSAAASDSGARRLAADAFAAQAQFVGLTSAALWAVQELNASAATGRPAMLLQHLVPELLAQGEQWLQQQQQQQQQQHDQPAPDADLACWRNRCLRSMLTGAAGPALDMPGVGVAAAPSPPCVWLPRECWQPLVAALEGAGASGPPAQRGWELLLPGWSATSGQHSSSSSLLPSQQQAQPRVLAHSGLPELLQHSRQLHKLQLLLLQLAVESQAAPWLLEQLLQACLALRAPAAPGGRRAGRPHAADQQAQLQERCFALLRLLQGVLAGPLKHRGLGGGCHVAQQQELADAALIEWD